MVGNMIPVHEPCNGNRIHPGLSGLFCQSRLLPLYLEVVGSRTPVTVVRLDALPFVMPRAKWQQLMSVDMKSSARANSARSVL
jgi:hypothetical protein